MTPIQRIPRTRLTLTALAIAIPLSLGFSGASAAAPETQSQPQAQQETASLEPSTRPEPLALTEAVSLEFYSQGHIKAAQTVLDATLAADVIPQAIYQLQSVYAHMLKDLPLSQAHRDMEDKYRDRAFALAEKQLSWTQIQPKYLMLYMDTYSEQELKDIANFYQTPAGKKYLKHMPATLRQASAIVRQQMKTISGEFSLIVTEFKNSL